MKRGKATSVGATRWRVDVYAYADDYPGLTTDPTAADKVIVDEIYQSGRITSVSLSRSKSSAAGEAIIRTVGLTPACFFVGNWVVVRSKLGAFTKSQGAGSVVSALKDAGVAAVSNLSASAAGKPVVQDEGLPRFVGQIYDVSNEYQVEPQTGNLIQTATVRVKEWSTLLFTPVRYDVVVAAGAQDVTGFFNLLANVVPPPPGLAPDAGQLKKISTAVLSPFEMVRLALAYVGALPDDNQSAVKQIGAALAGRAKKLAALTGESESLDPQAAYEAAEAFSQLASRMPVLPQKLLSDLGMGQVDPRNPFKKGFAQIASGVVQGPSTGGEGFPDPLAFRGFFSSPAEFTSSYADPGDRPASINITPDFMYGKPAWQIIQERCDSATCEVFTDFIYCGDPLKGAVQPVIVHRDKPFALRQFLDAAGLSNWTAYDDLPRVWVSEEFISAFSVKSTTQASPNFIKVEPVLTGVRSDYELNRAYLASITVLKPEQERFGGQETTLSTPYLAFGQKPGDVTASGWMPQVTFLNYLWKGLNYRFGSGSLVLKDNNVPFMVGQNVSFKFGGAVLCGHVESYSSSFAVNPDGSQVTQTQLELSYICEVQKDGSLTLPGSRLFNILPYVKEPTGGPLDTITGALAGKVTGGLAKAAGLGPKASTVQLQIDLLEKRRKAGL